ncbi:NADP-dependent oxidoreductase [Pedobacter aquatilis]|uniref:NADP-dependent oxidoreductase n=1 Tax=Pedobacter aquatilis TaxID=351343 RepID=UPI00292E4F18|nr:NADP-dependent oxidoreductase [Pedobacter aquatilis]
MKALILNEFGGVDNLIPTDIEIPAINDDQVLIKVKSISINPVDAKTRAGKGMAARIQDKLPVILGWDISGEITKTGTAITEYKIGDEVFGMLAFPELGNAYAEYVVANPSDITLKPKNISHNEAAAATLAPLTAWQALTVHGNVKAGDRVFIHAGSGGVGHYAIQLAKHLGAYVIASSSAANRDFVLSIGADEHIDYQAKHFEEVVSNIDFVLDTFSGDYIDRSLKILKKGGLIVSIVSSLNQDVAEKAAALGITGKNMLVYASGDEMKTLAALLEKGILKSHVSKTYSFDQIPEAHLQIESGRTVGKIVIEL